MQTMTQVQKQLLLKDLCARLPYGVICDMWFEWNAAHKITEVLKCGGLMRLMNREFNFVAKPYLRPMSSMTTGEWCEYCDACTADEDAWLLAGNNKYRFCPISNQEDFLNSHHFDHHGLIPMGLALEALEGMYKIE